jgi:hypothetical protein
MLLSAVSVLVIVLQSPEIPEGLMNNPVYAEHWLQEVIFQNNVTPSTETPNRYVPNTKTYTEISKGCELKRHTAIIMPHQY